MLVVLLAHAIAAAVAPVPCDAVGSAGLLSLALVPAASLVWVALNWPLDGHAAGKREMGSGGCRSCRWTSTCASTPWPR